MVFLCSLQSAAFAAVGTPASSSEPSKETQQDNPLFNRVQMKTAVEHANEVTRLYGVQVLSINVISADPVDGNLTRALASGAVAAAEALQAETAARGNSKAMKIETQTKAENSKVLAEAEASAAKIKAGGAAEVRLQFACNVMPSTIHPSIGHSVQSVTQDKQSQLITLYPFALNGNY